GESPEEAARRELREETGLEVGDLCQIGAFGEPGRDPRGWIISIAYVATVLGKDAPRSGDDAADMRWWPVTALPSLAFDHRRIIAEALARRGAGTCS
ncbi:MAG: NUDIX hydrolase, partial [Anaerolineae bacterium]|nr:NUDIX hydrolase [Anaerolineae bacterium]